jgi:hypothetical protein
VRAYPVSVESVAAEDGALEAPSNAQVGLQPGPYMAETYEVTVERQYVVVEVP